MKPKPVLRGVAFALAMLALTACGGSSGGDAPANGSSNWDEMKWDQDKWS